MKRLLLLILCFLFVGCSSTRLPTIPVYSAEEEIKIYVATDLHYFSPKLTDNGSVFEEFVNSGDGKQINYIDTIVDAFVEEVLEEQPHVVILSGDLSLNGEYQSHLDLAEKLQKIREAGIQILVIPGNHDINSPYAREFIENEVYKTELVDPEAFTTIYKNFGYTDALSYDETTLSYCMPISEKLWVVMLDLSQYLNNTWFGADIGGKITPETLEWLETILMEAEEKDITVLTVTHQNLLNHSSTLQEGYTIYNNYDLYKLMANYNVSLNLSGHIHIQHIQSKEVESTSIYDIATSSLAVYNNQYGVLTFKPNQDFHYQTKELDIENYAKKHNLTNEDLLNFESYSYQFYTDLTYNKFYKNFSTLSFLTEEEASLLAETMAMINPHYFSGTTSIIREDILSSEQYPLWEKVKDLFYYDYLRSMLKESELSPTELIIPLK